MTRRNATEPTEEHGITAADTNQIEQYLRTAPYTRDVDDLRPDRETNS